MGYEEKFKLLRAKILDSEGNVSELKLEKEKIERDLIAEKESREALVKQIEELEGKSKNLEEALEAKSDESNESETAIKALNEKIAILNKELIGEQKRSENFEIEANKVFEAEEQMMIINEELAMTKKKVTELETNVERERKQKQDLMENLKATDETTSEKLVQLENETRVKDSSIIELEHEVEMFKKGFEENLKKYNSASTEINELKKALKEAQNNSEKQGAETKQKQAEIETLMNKYDKSQKEQGRVESQ